MEYKKTAVPSKVSISNIVTLHRAECKPSPNRTGEAHDFPELVYVESGENNVIIDGACHLVREGEAIIFAPLSYHIGSEKNKELTLHIISFDLNTPLPAELYNKALSLTAKQTSVISEIFSTGLALFSKIPPNSKEKGMFFNGNGNDASLQIIKNNLELFILSLLKADEGDFLNDKNKVTEYLKKNISRNLSLGEIAKAVSMSTSMLKRTFDGGVINHFNDLKINAACEMIRQGDMNFTQIAESLGFSSLHYFSRLFKIKTGKSPSEYKKGAESKHLKK